MHYKSLVYDNEVALDRAVNGRIEEGYMPLGSISVSVARSEYNTIKRYAQAMVLIENKADEKKLKDMRSLVIQ